ASGSHSTQFFQIPRENPLRNSDFVARELLYQFSLRPDRGRTQDLNDQILARNFRSWNHARSKRHVKSAFCACLRFSASSQTREEGPSMTSAVISFPLYVGRQCKTIASSLASSSSF